MKKNARTLIILGAVLVVCIGAYIGVSVYNSNQAQKTAEETKAVQIYADGRSAPVNISYESGGKTLSFVLENDKWYAADNKDLPLNQTALTQIATALNGLTPVRTLDTASPLGTYGLDKPAYTLSASDSAGNAFKLLIGAQIGSNYYAMTEGGSKIYTIAPALAGYLNPDILSMITLDTIPTMSETTIDTIRLSSGTSLLTLDKHKNKDGTLTWFIVDGKTYTAADEFVLPEGSEGSPEKYIKSAVSGLSSAKFTSCAAFKPTADDLKTYGLESAPLTVTVDFTNTTGAGTLEQKTTKGTAVLEIGGALSDGSGYYAKVTGSQEINVLPATTAKPLLDALNAMGTAG